FPDMGNTAEDLDAVDQTDTDKNSDKSDETAEALPVAEGFPEPDASDEEMLVLNEGARIIEEAVEALNAPDSDEMDADCGALDRSDSSLSPEDEAELERAVADAESGLDEVPDASKALNEAASDMSVLVEGVMAEEEEAEEDTFSQATLSDEINEDHDAEAEPQEMSVLADEPSLDEKENSTDAEVSALVAEDATEDTPEAADVEDKTPEKSRLRRGLARLLGNGKRQVEEEERIFDEADYQMGDRESNMRRTAIQHLRAAVAATRAEKKAGVDVEETPDDTPYRTDLASVVKPRRPNAASPIAPRSQRPSEHRAAPLKLVAEQRVDLDLAPVLPRRVATADLTPMASEDNSSAGFTEFAEERGATELSELLEAAAAYMSDVEGREEFSRPMLMSKLKEVQNEQYSREDGLRSFGKLLRTGKLRKLKGGRFSVTDETDYRDDARSAG
ncbi:MAG: hypothetical protein AAGK37_23620, partial [Pseudomonadota bacterium]